MEKWSLKNWAIYFIGLFMGMLAYRLLVRDETWIGSVIAAIIISLTATLITYAISKWKAKKPT